MEVSLERRAALMAGCVELPTGAPRDEIRIRFGCIEVHALLVAPAPDGVIRLAPDLWDRLALPYEGIRLCGRWIDPCTLELGPSISVLHAGCEMLEEKEARGRADLYYGHVARKPGLYAFGFDEAIDWERSKMQGQVLDNRPGNQGRVVTAWFAIPAAVRLAGAPQRSVIDQLREATANRTFNCVGSLSKWRIHGLLSEEPALAQHLPETRLLRQTTDLALMLVQHRTVFVKDIHGSKGEASICVTLVPEGFTVQYLDEGTLMERQLPDLGALEECIEEVIGAAPMVVQAAIPIRGRSGRSLHFRIAAVRRPGGEWAMPVAVASVATDPRMIFTNQANGAKDQPLAPALKQHLGMAPAEAEQCAGEMLELSLKIATRLSREFDPLGILGIDLLVDTEAHGIWILDADTVPGFGHDSPAVDRALLRSQVEYGLSMQGEWA